MKPLKTNDFMAWWGMVDSNHRRHSQQIYSLIKNTKIQLLFII